MPQPNKRTAKSPTCRPEELLHHSARFSTPLSVPDPSPTPGPHTNGIPALWAVPDPSPELDSHLVEIPAHWYPHPSGPAGPQLYVECAEPWCTGIPSHWGQAPARCKTAPSSSHWDPRPSGGAGLISTDLPDNHSTRLLISLPLGGSKPA
jgi:hypothetical protein